MNAREASELARRARDGYLYEQEMRRAALAQQARESSGGSSAGAAAGGGAGGGLGLYQAYQLAKSAGLLGSGGSGLATNGISSAFGSSATPSMSMNIPASYLPSAGAPPAAPTLLPGMSTGAAPSTVSSLASFGSYAVPIAAAAAIAAGVSSSRAKEKRTKARDQISKAFNDRGFSKDNLNLDRVMNSPEVRRAASAEPENPYNFSGLRAATKAYDYDRQLKSEGKDPVGFRSGGWGKPESGMKSNTIRYNFVDNSSMYNGMTMPSNVNPLYGGDMKSIDANAFEFNIGRTPVRIDSSNFRNVSPERPVAQISKGQFDRFKSSGFR